MRNRDVIHVTGITSIEYLPAMHMCSVGLLFCFVSKECSLFFFFLVRFSNAAVHVKNKSKQRKMGLVFGGHTKSWSCFIL